MILCIAKPLVEELDDSTVCNQHGNRHSAVMAVFNLVAVKI